MSYQWPGNCMRVCHAHTFSAPCACALFVLQFCRKPRVCYLSHFRQCLFDPHATSTTWLQAIQVAIPNQRMKIQSTCCPAKGNPKNQTFQDPPELPKMWTHQHHHITTHPSSCRRTSAKAKFKLSSHHPWDTFYCLSSMFNRLPHLKQMGISNSQSPSSSEACSLLASRKACVHRFGSLTSAGQIDPVWMGQESAHGKHRRYVYIYIYMTTRLMSHKVASVKMNTCITGMHW